ncbi:MAG: flagellar hook-length control protein FliK, partial [Rhodospirillaceae bacterium]|nr:flagellar hook-length control protein FliK [Rhodospirillaceae bacterium]
PQPGSGDAQPAAVARHDLTAPAALAHGGAGQPTAPAQAHHNAPTAATPPPIAEQIAVQVHRAVNQGLDRITIQLSPADLGHIEVRLDLGDSGRVSASVAVARRAARDLLQRDVRGVARARQDAGLKTDGNGLSFSLRDDGRRDGGARLPFAAGFDTGARGRSEPLVRDVATVAAAIRYHSSRALDIRV